MMLFRCCALDVTELVVREDLLLLQFVGVLVSVGRGVFSCKVQLQKANAIRLYWITV
jgi:hypothetical protein